MSGFAGLDPIVHAETLFLLAIGCPVTEAPAPIRTLVISGEISPADVALIPLSRGQFALVDAKDAEALRPYRWYAKPKGRRTTGFYAVRTIRTAEGPRHVPMHRQLLGATWPGELVDHHNGDGLDNRRVNLRRATPKQNVHNTQRGRQGMRGVKWTGEGWRARIYVGRRPLDLGVFPTREQAADAYDRKAFELRGQFAVLNGITPTGRPSDQCEVGNGRP